MGMLMSECGCSNKIRCEDNKAEQENDLTSAKGSQVKNTEHTTSCCDLGDETSSSCCTIQQKCQEMPQALADSICTKNLKTTSTKSQYISEYTVTKMDCSAEEQMVRMALTDLKNIKGLAFDLPQRKLKVFHDEKAEPITLKLVGLGLGAKLERTDVAHEDVPNQPDPIQQVKVLKYLLGINAVLFFIELISGVIAASTGLIADSLDMFADAAVYGIALYAVGKAAQKQLKLAHCTGWIQLLLASMVMLEVMRRFIFGSEPESILMILVGLLALIGNVTCLYLISHHKNDGAHMKASWIFSANDVVVNMGVIFAGGLVAWTGSAYPDLVIGVLVSLFVFNGARKILALK